MNKSIIKTRNQLQRITYKINQLKNKYSSDSNDEYQLISRPNSTKKDHQPPSNFQKQFTLFKHQLYQHLDHHLVRIRLRESELQAKLEQITKIQSSKPTNDRLNQLEASLNHLMSSHHSHQCQIESLSTSIHQIEHNIFQQLKHTLENISTKAFTQLHHRHQQQLQSLEAQLSSVLVSYSDASSQLDLNNHSIKQLQLEIKNINQQLSLLTHHSSASELASFKHQQLQQNYITQQIFQSLKTTLHQQQQTIQSSIHSSNQYLTIDAFNSIHNSIQLQLHSQINSTKLQLHSQINANKLSLQSQINNILSVQSMQNDKIDDLSMKWSQNDSFIRRDQLSLEIQPLKSAMATLQQVKIHSQQHDSMIKSIQASYRQSLLGVHDRIENIKINLEQSFQSKQAHYQHLVSNSILLLKDQSTNVQSIANQMKALIQSHSQHSLQQVKHIIQSTNLPNSSLHSAKFQALQNKIQQISQLIIINQQKRLKSIETELESQNSIYQKKTDQLQQLINALQVRLIKLQQIKFEQSKIHQFIDFQNTTNSNLSKQINDFTTQFTQKLNNQQTIASLQSKYQHSLQNIQQSIVKSFALQIDTKYKQLVHQNNQLNKFIYQFEQRINIEKQNLNNQLSTLRETVVEGPKVLIQQIDKNLRSSIVNEVYSNIANQFTKISQILERTFEQLQKKHNILQSNNVYFYQKIEDLGNSQHNIMLQFQQLKDKYKQSRAQTSKSNILSSLSANAFIYDSRISSENYQQQ